MDEINDDNLDLSESEANDDFLEALPPPSASQPANLLQDLDRRQNEVIRELDLLNDRISKVLADWNRNDAPDQDFTGREAA